MSTTQAELQWLNTKEAAEYIRLSEWTTRKKMSAGEIQSVQVGRRYRTKPEWLDEYMESA